MCSSVQIIVVLVVALAASTANALPTSDVHWRPFQLFMKAHKRNYTNDRETTHRYGIFMENLRRIADLNARGGAKHGVNQFTDLSPEEFKKTYLGSHFKQPHNRTRSHRLPTSTLATTPSVDWRTSQPAVISAVKNQGQCGSCWAFSATETIESCHALTTGTPVKTGSPEQIVDCDGAADGCNGGFPHLAFEYVESVGGLECEASYPYTAGGDCSFDKADICLPAPTSWRFVSQSAAGEKDMFAQIAISPFSIAADAESWQTYSPS